MSDEFPQLRETISLQERAGDPTIPWLNAREVSLILRRLDELTAENARLRAYVDHIARQRTISEMDDDENVEGDFGDAYDSMILDARNVREENESAARAAREAR